MFAGGRFNRKSEHFLRYSAEPARNGHATGAQASGRPANLIARSILAAGSCFPQTNTQRTHESLAHDLPHHRHMYLRVASSFYLCSVLAQHSLGRDWSDWADRIRNAQKLEQQGRLAQAAEVLRTAIAGLSNADPESPLLPDWMGKLASLQQDLGLYADAQRTYEEAILKWEAQTATHTAGYATTLNNLGTLYIMTAQFGKAETAFRKSLALRVAAFGPHSQEIALSYSNLADDLFRAGRFSDAEDMARRAIDIWAPDVTGSQPDLAYNTLAQLALERSDSAAAIAWAELALKRAEGSRDNSARRIWYEHTLSRARELNGDWEGAKRALTDAFSAIQARPWMRSPDRTGVLRDYAALLRRMGEKKEAARIEKQAAREDAELQRGNWSRFSVDVRSLR